MTERGTCTRCGGAFGPGPSNPRIPECHSKSSCDDNLTAAVSRIYNAAAADLGPNLGGGSVLDLCADQLPHLSLADLRAALVRAGFTKYDVDELHMS